MAVNFAAAKTIIKNRLGESDTDTDTFVGQCLDMAQRDVARAHKWPSLWTRKFVNTVAPYSTGTVAVTNNSTTVTLTGGTWPSAVASSSYRFGLAVNSQWYAVATRSSDSVILLAHEYVGSTDADATYAVYKNVYSLDSTVDKVQDVWLHDGSSRTELVPVVGEAWGTDWNGFPTGSGRPTRFLQVENDASGNVQLMVGPVAPDAVYRLEYFYRKVITEGSFVLDESLVDLVMYRAQAMAYERDHFERSVVMMREWPRLLRDEIARSGNIEDPGFIVGEGRLLGDPDENYRRNLLNYGTVVT